MQKEIQLTADGSHTVAVPGMHVTYHSKHGAIGESMHVFIQAGLSPLVSRLPYQPIHILEIGFGTGLNTLLSLREAIRHQQPIYYQTAELFPLPDEIVAQLNYGQQLNLVKEFEQLHTAPWEIPVPVHPLFTLHKTQDSLLSFSTGQLFHCIYFDVFAPAAQPELWTQEVFEKLYNFITPGGILVTYCSKSIVRKAMVAAGFSVEKIPGPHGKREMVRAGKS